MKNRTMGIAQSCGEEGEIILSGIYIDAILCITYSVYIQWLYRLRTKKYKNTNWRVPIECYYELHVYL